MPPSTATYVRIPGKFFIEPIRYMVTAADATIARPGSTKTFVPERNFAVAGASAFAH